MIDNESTFELQGNEMGDHKIEAEPKEPGEKTPGGENIQRYEQPTRSEGNESEKPPSKQCKIGGTIQYRRCSPKVETRQNGEITDQRQKGKSKHAEIVPDKSFVSRAEDVCGTLSVYRIRLFTH